MLSVDLCSICGNNHSGACSAEPYYFYWFPDNVIHPPKEVQIVGEWHKWQRHSSMERYIDEKGQVYFQIQICIPVGKYQYKYIVDGYWNFDRTAPVTADSFGSFNNVVEIYPRKTYLQYIPEHDTKITSSIPVEGLKIIGSWDNWEKQFPMEKTYNNLKGCEENFIYLQLRFNRAYEFKFKLGKQYIIDEKYPTIVNQFGTLNNHIILYEKIISTPTKKQIHPIPMKCKNFAWEKISIQSDLPYERVQGHSMCNIAQYIYIFGGKMRAQFVHTLAKIQIHNFHNTAIEEVLPNARAFHNMVTYGNKIIIYGGHNNTILQDYYSFNTTEGIWQSSPQIQGTQPQKRQKQSCIFYEMLLVFFGGYYCSPDSEYQIFFNEIQVLDLQKMHWIPKQAIHITGELPQGRFSHSASLVYSDMYIFGGVYNSLQNLNLNDIWKLNLERVTELHWERIEPKGKKPIARHGHSMNTVNNFLVIFGGRADDDSFLNDVVVFDTQKIEWVYPLISGQTPTGRYYHAATVVGNEYIVIFGGRLKDWKRNRHLYLLKPKQFKPSLDIQEEQQELQQDK